MLAQWLLPLIPFRIFRVVLISLVICKQSSRVGDKINA
jgi:hypothetical protein